MRRSLRVLSLLTIGLVAALASVVWAIPSQQVNLLQLFQLNIRTDLELLADEAIGVGLRPELWTGNVEPTAPNFGVDLWFDSELLALEIYGETRPDDWFGATTRDPELLARNTRHDVELMADTIYGVDVRPDAWTGAPRIFRCSRSTQNLTRLLERFYSVRFTVPESVLDYCGVVLIEAEDRLFTTVVRTEAFQAQLPELLGSLRGDLERLADELLGLDNRPTGWVVNRDPETEGYLTQMSADLERLADDQLGAQVRPDAWLGQLGVVPFASYLNLRFDLELLTDLLLGDGIRPRGWQGTDPLAVCPVDIQNLLTVAELNFGGAQLPPRESFATSAEYCAEVTRVVNDFVENPPVPEVVEEEQEPDRRYIARSRLAFAYLDVAALQYMGTMPFDVEFRAWFRNFNESNMMFVSGADFALFIDRRFTTMPEEVFRTLPTLEGRRPLTFCDARWCNGPGPTPTPTGVGPIAAVLQAATQVPTPDPVILQEREGKILVSWNNIRVNYLLDRPETRTVQVTLEICADPSQIACEPVISVFNFNTNTPQPVIQTFNGLNVYEFPYGYITNVIVEGATRFSRDLWISEPLFRGG